LPAVFDPDAKPCVNPVSADAAALATAREVLPEWRARAGARGWQDRFRAGGRAMPTSGGLQKRSALAQLASVRKRGMPGASAIDPMRNAGPGCVPANITRERGMLLAAFRQSTSLARWREVPPAKAMNRNPK
jgi:hypothetical protein